MILNKMKGKTIFLSGLIGAVLITVLCMPSCKASGGGDTYLTVILQDVFTTAQLSGRVVLNGIDGQSGDRYKINDTVNSIEVEVDEYKRSYILGVVNGEVVFARDKNGTFKTYSLSSDKTMYAQIVPDGFDTVEFAKSIGNHAALNTGDGTVTNYGKSTIDVALWEAETAAGPAEIISKMQST